MLQVVTRVAAEVKQRDLERKVDLMGQRLSKLTSGRPEDQLLSTRDIAPHVGVTHPKTVERWVREKGLPCVRIGRNLRFRLGDVLRWRAQQES